MIPIREGTPAQFDAVRECLGTAKFTEKGVTERLEAPGIYHAKTIREGRTAAVDITDARDVLIRLFMDAEMVDWTTVRKRLTEPAVEALLALGLLTTARSSAGRCHATVLLYPVAGLYLTSDLNCDPDPDFREPPLVDTVYPALTLNTLRFMSFQPTTKCDAFLELCSGSGIAALAAARFARHSWAVDITERSTRFAAFNARLNRLENITPLQGDLYQAVRGLTFDRIAVHPPYVPAFENRFVFRDGGEDGEQITRRAIAELPGYLRPGGRFYCTCLATDRRDHPLEQRVRQMLGEAQADFDVILITMQENDPLLYYGMSAVKGRSTYADMGQRLERFRELEIVQLVYGTIVIQRKDPGRAAITVRRQMGSRVTPAEGDWLLRWEAAVQDPATRPALLEARPQISPQADLTLVMRAPAGQWMPAECRAGAPWPFQAGLECPVWTATLLERCDGKTTVRDLLAGLRERSTIAPDTSDDWLVSLVQALVSTGVLELDTFPLPWPPGPRTR